MFILFNMIHSLNVIFKNTNDTTYKKLIEKCMHIL
jgi:hypothetical protein